MGKITLNTLYFYSWINYFDYKHTGFISYLNKSNKFYSLYLKNGGKKKPRWILN